MDKPLKDMKKALECVLQSGHGSRIAALMEQRRCAQREHIRIIEEIKEIEIRLDAHLTEALSGHENEHRVGDE